MSEKIIVLVTDRDDNKHGEISVLDDPQKAERLVETLLEAGFEADRIRVFTGRSSEFQISNRPVVALMAEGDEAQSRPAKDTENEEAPAVEPPAEAEDPVSEAEDETPETKEEKAAATAEMAAPVRFSSLFRSA
ncbi:MAG: hypothetical protein V3S20_10935 [Dehalococcoidia bacterium]